MPVPIALQLYTLRDALAQDYAGVINHIAEIGYVGVETGSEVIVKQPERAQLFKALGLQIPGVGITLPIDEQKRADLDKIARFGCKYAGVFWFPPDQFQSVDQIKRLCDRLNEADAIVQQHGLTLFYHNHWFEFTPDAAGWLPHQIMVENVSPSVRFEIDVYWAKVGGGEPVEIVKRLGAKAPLLHIKDGPGVKGEPMTAVGEGSLDIPGIIKAGRGTTEWLIVELDECATDMMEAVIKSYRYLTSKGLARGNKS